MANYGISQIDKWQFTDIDLPQDWVEHLGEIEDGFRAIIWGESGQGKTEYLFQFTKMLAMHWGKVHVNNVEQGKSKTFKEGFKRQKMNEILPGKWMLGDKSLRDWDAYLDKVQLRGSGRVLVIDSITYWELNYQNIKQLHEMFPKKCLILVAYASDSNLRKIKHLFDLKIEVKNRVAHIISRYGSQKSWDIMANRPKSSGQPTLFN